MHRKETRRLSKNLKTQSKNSRIQKFFYLSQELVTQLTWKLNEAISRKIWIESKQMKINDIFDHFTYKA